MTDDNKYKTGYNDKYIVFGNKPRAFNSEQELRDLIMEYFQSWKEQQRPVTVAGLAVFMGIGKSTLHDYESGKYDTPENCYSDTIKEAKAYIENDKWEKGLLGFYNSAVCIFDLKNNHGCKDRIENENIGISRIVVIDSDDDKL